MTTTRTVTNVKIIIARDSMGGIDLGDYINRLENAVRAMPDLDPDAEIDVFVSGETRYEGLYSDSEPHQYDAMTDRLHRLAEGVYEELCRGE